MNKQSKLNIYHWKIINKNLISQFIHFEDRHYNYTYLQIINYF